MKKRVIYFGILSSKTQNALYQRASVISKMIQSLGYDPIIIGFDSEITLGDFFCTTENGFSFYNLHYPLSTKEWIRSLLDCKDIIKVFNHIGSDNIHAIIMADYRFFPMLSVKKYCETNDIHYIADIMDWFIMEHPPTMNSYIKVIDNWMRMRLFYPFVDRKICISQHFAKLYENTKRLLVLPGIVDPDADKWRVSHYEKHPYNLKLVFSGQPGKHCKKERIDWVLKAIYELRECYKICFDIIGIGFEDFIVNNPSLEIYARQANVYFHGRLPHEKCIEYIGNSDFSVVIREKNKLSEYGFSTKISESLACGTPVIATDTSDYKEYIIDGANGFICDCNYESVKSILSYACLLSDEKKIYMHQNARTKNCLICTEYLHDLEALL